jgi:hypothetical protein
MLKEKGKIDKQLSPKNTQKVKNCVTLAPQKNTGCEVRCYVGIRRGTRSVTVKRHEHYVT